jgi:hypothetical protein
MSNIFVIPDVHLQASIQMDLDSIICRNKGLLDALEKKKYV